MAIKNFQITDENLNKCKTILEILNCNLLWIMHPNKSCLAIAATDQLLLKHYINNKYYVYDPSLQPYSKDNPSWQVSIGTDCESFNKSGFLYDALKMFNIEEFVSLEHQVESNIYCYRFFTINNRFIFINQVIKNLPLIKHFANSMTSSIKEELETVTNLNLAS